MHFEPATRHAIDRATSGAAKARWRKGSRYRTGKHGHNLLAGHGLTFWIQWLAAVAATTALLLALVIDKTGSIDVQYRLLAVMALLGSIPVYTLLRVYHTQHGYLLGTACLLAAWLILLATLIALAFVTKTSDLYSREVLLLWTVTGFLLQTGLFIPLHHLSRRYQRSLQAQRLSVVVGNCDAASQLAYSLNRAQNETVIGLVNPDDTPAPSDSLFPILGNVAHLRELIATHRIRCIYVVLPLAAAEQIEGLYIDLLDANVDVIWMPDLNGFTLLNHSVSEIGGMPAIHLNESPLTSYPTAAMTKSLMDISIALLAIILLSPVLLATAIAVKLTSTGPVLFKQQRHGWNGQVIKVWKFRSMRQHDDSDVKQATRHDDRITPVGRFIRRTSIDELPQLFNVLQGRMSLVGPRPHAVAHNNYYTGKITAYMARHRIKPGITGLAQISGYRGETETLDKMEKRVELDLQYINNWSLWLDIKILIKTPFTLLGKDIY